MDISIVIPVRNEAANIAPLVREIRAALDGRLDYEIVYVDDGSADSTVAELRALKAGFPRLRALRHARRAGQSAALTPVRMAALWPARSPWIATLDGDGQNDPSDIPRLWEVARD
ncbi:MAG TPA: glycosyltransferase family 2 protein, partial [Stellaceae bacterium]|nr:glycosyltransferase family 2 protein [Stellaceae bacterium]